jgi:hypothetical protein
VTSAERPRREVGPESGSERSEGCEECGREPGGDEDYLDDWRCFSDGCGSLLSFCPECSRREFGRP